jgi:hypothetical protein
MMRRKRLCKELLIPRPQGTLKSRNYVVKPNEARFMLELRGGSLRASGFS